MLQHDELINNVFDDQKLNISLLPIHVYNDAIKEPVCGIICHKIIIVIFGFIILFTIITIICLSNK
jgi:hypothetical protein